MRPVATGVLLKLLSLLLLLQLTVCGAVPSLVLTEANVSNCFDHWRLLRFLLPESEVFVDIGANRGYVSVAFFNLWDPKHGLTPHLWKRCNKKGDKDAKNSCGSCSECREVYSYAPTIADLEKIYNTSKISPLLADYALTYLHPKKNGIKDDLPVRNITVFSFDGQLSLQNRHGNKVEVCFPSLKGIWLWETLAFSNVSGHTAFFQGDGWEKASIVEGAGGRLAKRVNMSSIDDWMQRHNSAVKMIDIMKIDVEGHDPVVLQGGLKTIKHKVKILLFEVSNRHYWSHTNVSEVIDMLEKIHMTCYITMRDYLMLRLTEFYPPSDKLKSKPFIYLAKRKKRKKYDAFQQKAVRSYSMISPRKSIIWGNVVCVNELLLPSVVALFNEFSAIEFERIREGKQDFSKHMWKQKGRGSVGR